MGRPPRQLASRGCGGPSVRHLTSGRNALHGLEPFDAAIVETGTITRTGDWAVNAIIYLVGLVVVVLAILSLLGLR